MLFDENAVLAWMKALGLDTEQPIRQDQARDIEYAFGDIVQGRYPAPQQLGVFDHEGLPGTFVNHYPLVTDAPWWMYPAVWGTWALVMWWLVVHLRRAVREVRAVKAMREPTPR